ncbi:Serine/threonine-protein kinase fray2 [Sparassis crispa]|uniref:Serine/threonine-protein kinase fray2 n=1 Tax=Sparassis crispa TaxID=139825 RepID=A0A401G8F9_9APHY|nr:Serine/threonine-protein kinase fray2 [Sparassis crispa]GBE78454.1 Serine/threonine-protein kinase fray2 [Sparassis crispa]
MNAATERIARKFIGAVEDEWQLYSDTFSDYTVGAPIGFGASSTVYAAQFQPPGVAHPTPCALKVLDLDRLPPRALCLLQRETQLMSLSKHPNVLRVRGTWMDGHKLYIAMRLMNAGSAADVMHYGWPGGMEEEVVRCILKQALEGINYLHVNGLIHRDVKAANLLIDDDGTVLLCDLGVATFLWDSEDIPPIINKRTVASSSSSSSSSATIPRHSHTHSHSQLHSHSHQNPHLHSPLHVNPHPRPKLRTVGKRKSFVGTPCWMAPEVINGRTYDASADIWSFGITALELTQGRAPRSLLTPHKALLQTVQDAPPQLDRAGGAYTYSRAFQEVVAACLNKDPTRRPTAAELLATPFFRGARKHTFLVGAVLKGLPPLAQRQERRRQPSVLTHGTMESWDFSTSIPTSPVQSVYGYHKRATSSVLPEDGVFEIEHEEAEGEENEVGEASSSTQANGVRADDGFDSESRNVSWTENHSAPNLSDSGPDTELPSQPILIKSSKADEKNGILAVPTAPSLSTSPSMSTSSHSSNTSKASASTTTSATSVSQISSPVHETPTSVHIPLMPSSPSRLWRRLIKRRNEKGKAADTKGDGRTVKKTLDAVLGKTASRTVGA